MVGAKDNAFFEDGNFRTADEVTGFAVGEEFGETTFARQRCWGIRKIKDTEDILGLVERGAFDDKQVGTEVSGDLGSIGMERGE